MFEILNHESKFGLPELVFKGGTGSFLVGK